MFAVYAAIILGLFYVARRFGCTRAFTWVFVFLAGAAYLGWGALHPADWDEIEQLHSMYLVSEGLVPFVDFWQIHSPLLWVVLAPGLEALPETGAVLLISRCLYLLLSLILFSIIWRLSRHLWGEQADLCATLLVFLSVGIVSQFLWIRPDAIMLLGAMAAIGLALAGFEGERGSRFFLSGLALALGLTFSHKVLLWCLLVPISSLVLYRRRPGRMAATVALHMAGVATGVVPLAVYLSVHHLWEGFRRWVVEYHGKPITLHLSLESGHVLLLAAAAVIVILVGLSRLPTGRVRVGRVVFGTATFLILTSAVFLYPIEQPWFCYYLAPLFLLSAVLCSWIGRPSANGAGLIRAVLIPGLLLAGLTFSHFRSLVDTHHRELRLGDSIAIIDGLLERARNRPVYCVIPFHPIFTRDASPFYLPWQTIHLERKRDTRKKRMLIEFFSARPDFAADLMESGPGVLDERRLHRSTGLLVAEGLLPPARARALLEWAARHYHRERIRGREYLVRD